jgi:hypothetical protein
MKNLLKKMGYKGIAVNDAVPIQTVINLGVTMAWTLNPDNPALIHNKILVAGNDKMKHPCYSPPHGTGCHPRLMEQGFYFIATITRIERCAHYVIATGGMADASFRQHHCFFNYPILTPYPENNPRYAVYFDNSINIPILHFSNRAFRFPMMPVIYFP